MGRIAGLTSAETRQRVAEAAAAEFAERGFDGARISSIAKRAGLSTGAIYNHYRSKAALLAAVIDSRAATELSDLLLDRDTPPAGVLDVIASSGAGLQRRGEQSSLLAEAILTARRDPAAAAGLAAQVTEREQWFADVVRFAQTSGEATSEVDPEVVSRFCLMLVLGSLLVDALDLPPTDQDAWSAFINRLIDGFRTKEIAT